MVIEIRGVHRALKSRRLRHPQEVRHLRSPIHVSKTFTKWSARIDVGLETCKGRTAATSCFETPQVSYDLPSGSERFTLKS